MTDVEFDRIRKECEEHKERTSYPAIDPKTDYESRGRHAEFDQSAH